MDTLELKLNEILEKTEYLGQKAKHLAAENRSLRAALAAREAELQEQQAKFDELSHQYEILKMARNLGEGTPNEKTDELKSKINDYIREIDQCLKLIGD